MRAGVGIAAILTVAFGLSGCSDRSSPEPAYDAARKRRVIEPPPGEVRPLPPHAIHDTGIGPYVIATSLQDTLDLLPRGPRVELMEIDDLVDYNLVRAEDGSVIIGVEPPYGVSFLAVLDREIAKTETQVGVGSTETELRLAMGAPLARPGLAMDPRIARFDKLPTVRFVLEEPSATTPDGAKKPAPMTGPRERRVSAVVVVRGEPGRATGRPGPGEDSGPGPAAAGEASSGPGTSAPTTAEPGDRDPRGEPRPGCRARELLAGLKPQLRAAARLGAGKGTAAASPAAQGRLVLGCFSGAQPEALVARGDRLAMVAMAERAATERPGRDAGAAAPPKLKRGAIYTASAPILYVAAVDMDGDGRHEIALVTREQRPRERIIGLELLRGEAGRITRVSSQELYRVSETSAAWIGARLDDIELLIELEGSGDRVEASGLYLQRGRDGFRTVARLLPKTLVTRRRRATGPAPAPSAAILDGGAPPPRNAPRDAGPSAAAQGDAGPGPARDR